MGDPQKLCAISGLIMAQLFLIPTPIAEGRYGNTVPEIPAVVSKIKYYVVERTKTARRFLRGICPEIVIDDLSFFEIDKGFDVSGLYSFLEVLKSGEDVALLSEAGCPAVADPGHMAVAWCHKQHIEVRPLVGPSSIIMALMSSGFNGQQFTFHGYLPNKAAELSNRLRMLDKQVEKTGATQIFIETPYRNGFMISTIIESLPQERWLCVACDLDGEGQFVKTKRLSEWKKLDLGFLHKQPAVFLLGRFDTA